MKGPIPLLTNHGHVLCAIAEDSTARVRDLASRVALTERAVLRILSDLEAAGWVRHRREGRRNVYELQGNEALAHENERHLTVAKLVAAVVGNRTSDAADMQRASGMSAA